MWRKRDTNGFEPSRQLVAGIVVPAATAARCLSGIRTNKHCGPVIRPSGQDALTPSAASGRAFSRVIR